MNTSYALKWTERDGFGIYIPPELIDSIKEHFNLAEGIEKKIVSFRIALEGIRVLKNKSGYGASLDDMEKKLAKGMLRYKAEHDFLINKTPYVGEIN